ncbi:MAG: PEP-CTERM sorting domain-containing protein [Phycisphaerae bacterium]|nr:PEP-CTERM sorting domain-containing protein [Phycisphaerae bacterium]
MSVAVLLAIWVAPAPSHAETIVDFDGLFALDEVTTQYQGLGVTFGADPALDTLCNLIVASPIMASSAPNLLGSAFDNTDGVISFLFSPPAIEVAFTAVSVEDGMSVQYYDSGGLLISTDSRSPADDYITQVSVTFSSSEIGSVVILAADEEGQPDSFAIDDLTFTLMPEPASIALLAFGVLGILGRKAGRARR